MCINKVDDHDIKSVLEIRKEIIEVDHVWLKSNNSSGSRLL